MRAVEFLENLAASVRHTRKEMGVCVSKCVMKERGCVVPVYLSGKMSREGRIVQTHIILANKSHFY